ncbi:MAG: M14 family metallopeptidase [Bryobacteraceae bacterium]|nr:M14 family metallopeptidase [Bryobacteraceae bacterium]
MRRSLFLLAAAAVAVSAQQKFEFWPGAQYDPAIPTVEKVLGFEPGTRHATHADIVRYFEALAAAAPSRIRLFDYGRTWEGRRLFYAAISGEDNIRRLAEIRAAQQRLADPRKTPEAEAKKLIASSPSVLALMYGVHGNEISSPDAALLTAYHLLAARNDAMMDQVRRHVVVLLDPLQNPDGRERFIYNFVTNLGLEPDPNPAAAERAEPWPGGRSNHYLFDMNRDWFALTQPETQGRVRYLREWLPHVVVDLHEMGTNSTYFFTPGAPPYNPHITADQKKQMQWFGQNNAKYFDRFGWPYFTREVFDEFYPGYGASWPWFYGGMGMTYENASVRGLVVRRSDDTLYGYQESVQKHFVASIATCETAARQRQQLLESFWRYQVTAIEEGRSEPVKTYVLPRRGDTSAVDKLAALLAEHGIEVLRASADFEAAGKKYPAGSYLISAAQPRKRLIRALLDRNVPMDEAFVKEQERRRKKGLPDEIYDVTGWSLPLMYNVECDPLETAVNVASAPVAPPYQPKGSVSGRAEVAYLVPWGTQASGRFLTAALRSGLRILTANKPFAQNGRKYPSGTLIVMVKQNGADVHDRVARLAAASGAEVIATNSSWVDDGIDFGSNHVSVVRRPSIALVWDAPTSSLAAGATRFVLERQYGYPVTVIRASNLAAADLNRFHVLILPDAGGFGGGYGTALNAAAPRIQQWVREGGVLIGIGAALSWLSNPQVNLLAIQQEQLAREGAPAAGTRQPEPAKPAAAPPPSAPAAAAPQAAAAQAAPVPGRLLTKEEDFEKAVEPETRLPDAVAGVIVRARVDPETWVTAGLPETVNVLVDGRDIYTPIRRDRGVNAVVFDAPERLLLSGYLWEENRRQLAFKPFVVVSNQGRGVVVGFTEDPNFRAFHDGLNVLFLNAVFRFPGPAVRGGAEEEQRQ